MIKDRRYLLGCSVLSFLLIIVPMLVGFFIFPIFINPLFNFFDLFRVPNFQEHKWTSMKVEYYTLSDSNFIRLKSEDEDRRGNDFDLRDVKYFTSNNPENVQKAMSLIQVKDWWPMSIGVQRGTEVHDETGNIWDMCISPGRIYIAKRGTTASYGFEVNNDFAYYIRKLAFENEKRTNPNTKFEYIGLTCFNVYDLNHQSSRDYQK